METTKKNRWAGMRWRAAVIVGLVIAVVSVWNSADEDQPAADTDYPVLVEYSVAGDAMGADVTYTADDGTDVREDSVGAPLTDTDGNPKSFFSMVGRGTPVQVTARTAMGSLTCQILIDGEVVAEETDALSVTCTATP